MDSMQVEIRLLRAENMTLHDEVKTLREDVTSLCESVQCLLGVLTSRLDVTANKTACKDGLVFARDVVYEVCWDELDENDGTCKCTDEIVVENDDTEECADENVLENDDTHDVVLEKDGPFTAGDLNINVLEKQEVVLEEDEPFTAGVLNVTGTPPRNIGYRSRIRSQMKREINNVVSKEADDDGPPSGSDISTNNSVRTRQSRVSREIKRMREAAAQTVPKSLSL